MRAAPSPARTRPTRARPLGVKGAGEAGSIGATPAAMNAVVDALYRGYGIKTLDMPAIPLKVWQAIHEASGKKAAKGQ